MATETITINAEQEGMVALNTSAATISANDISVGTVYYTSGCITIGTIGYQDYHENFLFECEYCGCFDDKPGNCKHCGAPLKIYHRR